MRSMGVHFPTGSSRTLADEVAYADAMLTAKGRQQAQELHDLTKGDIQQTADLIVSSVVRDQ
jgi:broad specificity phosphatase PhoE